MDAKILILILSRKEATASAQQRYSITITSDLRGDHYTNYSTRARSTAV